MSDNQLTLEEELKKNHMFLLSTFWMYPVWCVISIGMSDNAEGFYYFVPVVLMDHGVRTDEIRLHCPGIPGWNEPISS